MTTTRDAMMDMFSKTYKELKSYGESANVQNVGSTMLIPVLGLGALAVGIASTRKRALEPVVMTVPQSYGMLLSSTWVTCQR
jgi:hypothetical protein